MSETKAEVNASAEEIDWHARAAEIRTADSEELSAIYEKLGIAGNMSALDEIERLTERVRVLEGLLREAKKDDESNLAYRINAALATAAPKPDEQQWPTDEPGGWPKPDKYRAGWVDGPGREYGTP